MNQFGIVIPTPNTLKKYGLTFEAWEAILARQGGVCGACGEIPGSRKLFVDHEHVKGWKDMPDEKRRLYVRGLVCYMCNKYRLARGATPVRLLRAAEYLARYLERKELGL